MNPLREQLMAEAIARMVPYKAAPSPVVSAFAAAARGWRMEIERERALLKCYYWGPAHHAKALDRIQSYRRHIASIKELAKREGVAA